MSRAPWTRRGGAASDNRRWASEGPSVSRETGAPHGGTAAYRAHEGYSASLNPTWDAVNPSRS